MTFRVGMRIQGLIEANNRFVKGERNMRVRVILALRRAAALTERELKKGLQSGSPGGEEFAALSPITRLLRKGSKPLIDQGDLLGSIKSTVNEGALSAFVGVHRTTRSTGGTDVVNVAAIHEFGVDPFVIPVTQGVRRFFLALFFLSGGVIKPLSPKKTQILHPGIPARPFIRPTIEKIRPKISKLISVTISSRGGPI